MLLVKACAIKGVKQFEIKEYEEKLKRINWLINLEKETILKDKKSFKKLQKEYFKSLND